MTEISAASGQFAVTAATAQFSASSASPSHCADRATATGSSTDCPARACRSLARSKRWSPFAGSSTNGSAARRATVAGTEIVLTAREYSLLEYLSFHRGEVVSRATLYEHLFDEADDSLSNLLDVHVSNLRKKLGHDLIATRRGLGYSIGFFMFWLATASSSLFTWILLRPASRFNRALPPG